MGFEDLPDELLEIIMGFAMEDAKNSLDYSLVCKSWCRFFALYGGFVDKMIKDSQALESLMQLKTKFRKVAIENFCGGTEWLINSFNTLASLELTGPGPSRGTDNLITLDGIRECTRLERLVIRELRFRHEKGDPPFKFSHTLKSLELSRRNGMIYVSFSAIKECIHLQRLVLHYLEIGDDAPDPDFQLPQVTFCSLRSLSGSPKADEIVSRCPALEELHLGCFYPVLSLKLNASSLKVLTMAKGFLQVDLDLPKLESGSISDCKTLRLSAPEAETLLIAEIENEVELQAPQLTEFEMVKVPNLDLREMATRFSLLQELNLDLKQYNFSEGAFELKLGFLEVLVLKAQETIEVRLELPELRSGEIRDCSTLRLSAPKADTLEIDGILHEVELEASQLHELSVRNSALEAEEIVTRCPALTELEIYEPRLSEKVFRLNHSHLNSLYLVATDFDVSLSLPCLRSGVVCACTNLELNAPYAQDLKLRCVSGVTLEAEHLERLHLSYNTCLRFCKLPAQLESLQINCDGDYRSCIHEMEASTFKQMACCASLEIMKLGECDQCKTRVCEGSTGDDDLQDMPLLKKLILTGPSGAKVVASFVSVLLPHCKALETVHLNVYRGPEEYELLQARFKNLKLLVTKLR